MWTNSGILSKDRSLVKRVSALGVRQGDTLFLMIYPRYIWLDVAH